MKKLSLILFILLFTARIMINGQDVINPYITTTLNYPFTQSNNTKITLGNSNIGGTDYSFDFFINQAPGPGGFLGEYEINIGNHFWWNNFVNYAPGSYSLSYQYELVSFPFAPPCAFTDIGCDGVVPLNERKLYMPDPVLSTFINDYWDYSPYPGKLFRLTPLDAFPSSVPPDAPSHSQYSSGLMSSNGDANSLVSGAFPNNEGFDGFGPNDYHDRKGIPHSVIKHTVNLHCGYSPTTLNILSSFSWYYDNTRGGMRNYPFVPTNSGGSGQAEHDEVFIPELVVNNSLHQVVIQGVPTTILYEHVYDDTNGSNNTPSQIIMPNGALNYFPYSEISNGCGGGVPNPSTGSSYSYFRDGSGIYFSEFPSSNTLYSSNLRQYNSNRLAGFGSQISTGILYAMTGIQHDYFVDQDLDLTIINPTDHTIYNPSEVNITAGDLHFPAGYTFKTIRGAYPTVTEVGLDDIIENGGPFNDPRDVPVKTDLTSENPNDAGQPYTHLFASRYYLNDPTQVTPGTPKLTIEQCVKLFDCTFDVYPGGTLQFDEYPSNLGKEDHSTDHNDTRYKIQTLGGAVLRNFARVQYLQNGDITQQAHLHYKATDEIIAGHFVDTDTDVPPGDYSIKNGANVTLQATNVIRLTDGFNVRSGATFHAYTASPGTPVSNCTTPDNNRKAGSQQAGAKHKIDFLNLSIQPNPTPNKIRLMQFNLPVKAQQLEIMDSFGRIVFEKQEYNGASDLIDLSHQPNGLYIARCITNGEAHQVKFVVNK